MTKSFGCRPWVERNLWVCCVVCHCAKCLYKEFILLNRMLLVSFTVFSRKCTTQSYIILEYIHVSQLWGFFTVICSEQPTCFFLFFSYRLVTILGGLTPKKEEVSILYVLYHRIWFLSIAVLFFFTLLVFFQLQLMLSWIMWDWVL